MARLLGNPQLIRWMLLLALLTSAFAVPLHSQSSNANPTPEPTPPAKVSAQESTQPAAVAPATELPPTATPEQLRKAEIEADTKKLYQLSAELRTEVAKTYKESLSVAVLKKAEEVEVLARSLRVLMSKEATAKH